MDFAVVKEKKLEPYFTVNHWLFEVPTSLYLEVLQKHNDPYTEEAVQEFVSQYLIWKGDDGLVGLVGLEDKGERVFIDAAIRYSH